MQMEGVPQRLVLKADQFPSIQGSQEVKFLFGILVKKFGSFRYPMKFEWVHCERMKGLFFNFSQSMTIPILCDASIQDDTNLYVKPYGPK